MNRPRSQERGFFILVPLIWFMKVGDIIHHIDGVERGRILAVLGDRLQVFWEDLEIEEIVQNNEVVVIQPEIAEIISGQSAIPNKEEKVLKASSSKKAQKDSAREIDLHIENLLPTTKGMTNHEIVQVQLQALYDAFEEARADRCKRLIVIHGVGEGRLREEVLIFLSGQDDIEFFDASYQKYGQGATEVRFYKYS